ncbi:hypothetical protein EGW08_010117 [Elysia chlorotica]|uniref:Endonuclease/exonuclease/phosphatase domain-containing protein n=1 Tax=Elysia chlorotica TaxID=188477 RepID=A0A3S0ZT30_ELYCH|nr:hypothetical protein EGW08_010117 [Elysia chlorotica]
MYFVFHLEVANVYIVGDFNFHYENKNISSVSTFHSLIEEHGLTQHVEQPTHKHQHILDLVMSRCETNHLFGLKVNDICLSDHYIISFGVNIDKPPLIKKCFFTRDIKSVDINKFKETVSSILSTNNPRTVETFNIILRDVLDQFAPLCERRISARLFAPWFTSRVQTAKQVKRRAERRFIRFMWFVVFVRFVRFVEFVRFLRFVKFVKFLRFAELSGSAGR